MENHHDIIIIGGGLAGLSNAIHLSAAGLDVVLIEKNEYPKHKVCGEYISNEVLPYLNWLGIDPFAHGATNISRFELSTSSGKNIRTKLPLGGFGISRYRLDALLMQRAKSVGCQVFQDIVENVAFSHDQFSLRTKSGKNFTADFVIGAYGKRSKLDKHLDRDFISKQAPYLGVKAHYKGDFPNDLVALHNFKGGYCGVSKVEDQYINICYLADYKSYKAHKSIAAFQNQVVAQNPNLKNIFARVTMSFEQPLTISQVSFLPKKTVEGHVLMSGDAAGMIHPLCGNGMGMAIHSAMLLSELLIDFYEKKMGSRAQIEKTYQKIWDKTFSKRLFAGKIFNLFFTHQITFDKALGLISNFPSALPLLIRQTHGEALETPHRKILVA